MKIVPFLKKAGRLKRSKKRLFTKGFWKRGWTSLKNRFLRSTLGQQVFSTFVNSLAPLALVAFRIRDSLSRLSFIKSRWWRFFKLRFYFLWKRQQFLFSLYQIIVLNYYKSAATFTEYLVGILVQAKPTQQLKGIKFVRKVMDVSRLHPNIRPQFYGFDLEIAGRFQGKDQTYVYRIVEGLFSTQTYRRRLGFGLREARTRSGSLGVRTTLFY